MVRTFLDHLATAALLVIAASVVWDYRGRERPLPSTPIPTTAVTMENAPRRGNPSAPVALMIFSDFQCQFCGRFATDTLPGLIAKYVDTGAVQVLFRHYYNSETHKRAEQFAQASICAGDQQRFWEAHDRLFAMPANEASVDQLVSAVGLDRSSFERCMSTQAFSQLDADRRLADVLGIVGTPTTVIGKVTQKGLQPVAVINGAQPQAVFEAAIGRAQ